MSKIRKRVYQQKDGIKSITNEKPNAEKSKQFWSNIWDNEKEHERNAEWLRKLGAEKDNMKQNDIDTTTEMIKVQGYWLKKLTALNERIAKQMNNIISNREDIPK